jgi:hypothetical protein
LCPACLEIEDSSGLDIEDDGSTIGKDVSKDKLICFTA